MIIFLIEVYLCDYTFLSRHFQAHSVFLCPAVVLCVRIKQIGFRGGFWLCGGLPLTHGSEITRVADFQLCVV